MRKSYLRSSVAVIAFAIVSWCCQSNTYAQGSLGGWGSSGGSTGASLGWGSSGGHRVGALGGSSGGWGSSGGRYFNGQLRSRVSSWRPSFGSSGGSSGGWTRRVSARRPIGYGSSGGGVLRNYGSSGGGWGVRRRSFGSSGGGYASTGSVSYGSTGSVVGYGSTGSSYAHSLGSASYGSTGSYSSPVTYSSPVVPSYSEAPYYGTPADAAPMLDGPMNGITPGPVVDPTPVTPTPEPATGSAAILKVNVPSDAIVYVNNKRTKTPGTNRSFVSKNLKPGFKYTYHVRAEVVRNGKTESMDKTVELRAGLSEKLDFNFNMELVTSLKLNVPVDAVVKLGGKRTKAVGPVRVFSTSRLKAGQQWKDYVVNVTYKVDGRDVTEEKVVTIDAGNTAQLNFGYNGGEQVASK